MFIFSYKILKKIICIHIINTSQNSVNQYIGTIGFASLEFDGREYDYVAFNQNSSYLSSSNVRKALSYYIDKNNCIASSYGNGYRVSDFPLDYGNFLYQKDIIDADADMKVYDLMLKADGIVDDNLIMKGSGQDAK